MILSELRGPQDLKSLSLDELQALVLEIRQTIIQTCLEKGGHLGASLGPVEIAVALHYVFSSPKEPIIWDVGHQAYAHKLLTGRWDRFSTLRSRNGLSGFLSREESPHDVFGAGHSSTSFSAATGIAIGRRLQGEGKDSWTVAVMGDGGLTAGLAFEGMNQWWDLRQGPMLVVLNDNQMSIAPNVGGVSAFLREGRAQEFFECMGAKYYGPITGHDLSFLLGTLGEIRRDPSPGVRVLHVLTEKGKGYPPAEKQPTHYHGVGPAVRSSSGSVSAESWSEAVGEILCELARKDSRVCAITAAMPEGTGLLRFAREFPDRFFDVGIAEGHAVTFSAGLAASGMRPFVAIYSTFFQRAIDSLIHDAALQNLPVTLLLDRAGLVGADGPTHHGIFDAAILRPIPNLKIFTPLDRVSLESALSNSLDRQEGVEILRYPRGAIAKLEITGRAHPTFEWLHHPSTGWVIGVLVGNQAQKWKKILEALPVDVRPWISLVGIGQVKPLPSELREWIETSPSPCYVVVEDGVKIGGFGSTLAAEFHSLGALFESLGVGDHFVPHGTVQEQEADEGFSISQIASALQRHVEYQKEVLVHLASSYRTS